MAARRSCRTVIIIVGVVVGLGASSVGAGEININWTGDGGDNLWSNPLNWDFMLIAPCNQEGVEFGHKRLEEAFKNIKKDETAQEILDEVLLRFRKFLGEEKKRDDLTIILLRKR